MQAYLALPDQGMGWTVSQAVIGNPQKTRSPEEKK